MRIDECVLGQLAVRSDHRSAPGFRAQKRVRLRAFALSHDTWSLPASVVERIQEWGLRWFDGEVSMQGRPQHLRYAGEVSADHHGRDPAFLIAVDRKLRGRSLNRAQLRPY